MLNCLTFLCRGTNRGPAAVALLGGAHQDSRFRRGLGGTLSPHYEVRNTIQINGLEGLALAIERFGFVLQTHLSLSIHSNPFFMQLKSLTSNVPFVAMLTGKQGSQSWEGLWKETKPLNAMAAVAVSSLWVLRRMR